MGLGSDMSNFGLKEGEKGAPFLDMLLEEPHKQEQLNKYLIG